MLAVGSAACSLSLLQKGGFGGVSPAAAMQALIHLALTLHNRSAFHGFSRSDFSRAATAVVALACVLAPSFALAGSTYQLAFDQFTYQVDPDGKVVVSVDLQEQVTGGSTSVLATDGLIGAGMRYPSTCAATERSGQDPA